MPSRLTADRVAYVPTKSVTPDPAQPRRAFSSDALRELTASVKSRGVKVPIIVTQTREGAIVIVDGERRWRAARAAKLAEVPVILAPRAPEAERRIDQVLLNQQREPLSPMDLARWLRRMTREQAMSPNDLAARMTRAGVKALTPDAIERTMMLLDLPGWAQEHVDAERIEPADAVLLLDLPPTPKALQTAERLVDHKVGFAERLTRADVLDVVRRTFDSHAIWLGQFYEGGTRPTVYFDPRKVCRGCEYLRKVERADAGWCLNGAKFREHNDQAREAGLLPGGVVPKVEPRQDASREQLQREREERAAHTQEQRATEYLRRYVQTVLSVRLTRNQRASLIMFAACGQPGRDGWGSDQGSGERVSIARDSFLNSAADFLQFVEFGSPQWHALEIDVSNQVLGVLDWEDVQPLAHLILGRALRKFWRVDAEFLRLLTKDELVAYLDGRWLPDGRENWLGAKNAELIAALLEHADEVEPHPLILSIYEFVAEPFRSDDLEEVSP